MAWEFNIHNIADVKHSGKWYKINSSGKILTQSRETDNGPDYFYSGLSQFEKNGKIGFINEF